MKVILTFCLLTLVLACSNPYKETVNTEENYRLIPRPESMEIINGRFLVDDGTNISFEPGLEKEAGFLAGMLSEISGKSINTEAAGRGSGDIFLTIDSTMDFPEGYHLSVNYDKININGKTLKGIFYGIQTLRQLISADTSEGKATVDWTIPAIDITDAPRFDYRGMMLDVARHFFSVDFVKKYIDVLAFHKMNRFHWHLTDDQGWRIEIKQYPKLTEVGAYRNGTITGHYPGTGNDNKRYGGFYTQEEVKDIVAYAADRHITVIPEIELPGHASAAIASYPYLSCFPDEPTKVPGDMMSEKSRELQKSDTPKIVQETWGVFDDVYCAGNEKTYEFLENVLSEVIPLFPSRYVHIGGDECPKANWERCSSCQALMRKEGLKDEHELQSYFVHRIEKFLNSKGKSIIGWDEITEGGLSPTATIMYWRSWIKEEPVEVAAQGNDIIMTPTGYCYFDYYQVDKEHQAEEPLAIGGYLPVEKVYSLEPIPVEVSTSQEKQFLGTQGNLWTEYIDSGEQAEYMVLPRMAALAEVAWSPKDAKDWESFHSRLPHLVKMYDDNGWNYAKHALK